MTVLAGKGSFEENRNRPKWGRKQPKYNGNHQEMQEIRR